MELENIVLRNITQSQKNTHDMHLLISGYQLKGSEYSKYNSQTKELKKKKDQNVDASALLRRGNKIPTGEKPETKYVAVPASLMNPE